MNIPALWLWLVPVGITLMTMLYEHITFGAPWQDSKERTHRLAPLIFIFVFIYYWLQSRRYKKLSMRCTEEVLGTVIAISDSHLEVNRRRYLNVVVDCLGRQSELKNLEPEFRYTLSIGGKIPLLYNPENLGEIAVNYDALAAGGWDNSAES